jgi:uncharacterized protein YjbI with pentapeptide repeats/DNA-binding Xre family transcriptional regulator
VEKKFMAESKKKRSPRSHKASEKGIAKAESALMHRGWSRNDLETEVLLSRSTIGYFFTGKPIDKLNFREICRVLDLDWEEIIDCTNFTATTPNADPVISEVTVEQSQTNQEQSGTIQVLTAPVTGTTEQQETCEYQAIIVLSAKLTADNAAQFKDQQVKIEAIVTHLQTFVEDLSLTIRKIEPGSIKITLGGSEEGLKRLAALFDSGELTEVLGIPVEDVELTTEEDDETALENKFRLVRQIRTQGAVGRDLSDVNLSGVNLSGVNLSSADLNNVDLSDADLSGTNLNDANLRNANLEYANLSRANLSRADLSDADLSDADLSDANLSGANLSGANLIYADLSGANLIYADLSGANLSGANLIYADLSGANLSDADLSGANLSDANLDYANLNDADLNDANLSGVIQILDKGNKTKLPLSSAGSGSLRLAPEYIPRVKSIYARRFGNMRTLADSLELTRSTIHNFLYGTRVSRESFIKISEALGLNWKVIGQLAVQELPKQ